MAHKIDEELWDDIGSLCPDLYRSNFLADCEEYGQHTAIYNLGFLMGWDDRNEEEE